MTRDRFPPQSSLRPPRRTKGFSVVREAIIVVIISLHYLRVYYVALLLVIGNIFVSEKVYAPPPPPNTDCFFATNKFIFMVLVGPKQSLGQTERVPKLRTTPFQRDWIRLTP